MSQNVNGPGLGMRDPEVMKAISEAESVIAPAERTTVTQPRFPGETEEERMFEEMEMGHLTQQQTPPKHRAPSTPRKGRSRDKSKKKRKQQEQSRKKNRR